VPFEKQTDRPPYREWANRSELDLASAYKSTTKHIPVVKIRGQLQTQRRVFKPESLPQFYDKQYSSSQASLVRFNQQTNRSCPLKANSDYDQTYDRACTQRTKASKRGPEFKKTAARDNSMFRINEGNNLDPKEPTFFERYNVVELLTWSKRKP
jgi:hypothetical protein